MNDDALNRGIYTVRETVHILSPSLTSRKVHYWLDEGILPEPIRWGRRGVPTLLSYDQVVRIKTLQRLRDDLGFSLRKSREALAWITEHIMAPQWRALTFFRTGAGQVGITDGKDTLGVPGNQGLFEQVLPELQVFLQETRTAWERRILTIGAYDLLVSDPRVMGGSPIVAGTRIETAFIAHLSAEVGIRDLRHMYPHIEEAAIRQAAEFEAVELAA